MSDIRSSRPIRNSTHISNLPIESTEPQNGQTLSYDSDIGYWVWRSVLTPTGDTTLTDPVTFDSTLRIGANGNQIYRMNTFLGQDLTALAPSTTVSGNETVNPAYNYIPRYIGTFVAPDRSIADTSSIIRNPQVDEFDYAVRNFSTQPTFTTSDRGRLNGIIIA